MACLTLEVVERLFLGCGAILHNPEPLFDIANPACALSVLGAIPMVTAGLFYVHRFPGLQGGRWWEGVIVNPPVTTHPAPSYVVLTLTAAALKSGSRFWQSSFCCQCSYPPRG